MKLDPDHCYTALGSRDRRFDGVFFVAVVTTGIYCRPICPAPLPRRDHCRFFETAATAERAGYRACLRCRPEIAPGNAAVDARSSLVRAATARIRAGFLNDHRVQDLAAALDVSARHLRRVLAEELGVTPVELAQTRRLAMAKQLLHETSLPMTRVAFGAGFSSVRRFNALFRARFGGPPSALRNGRHAPAATGEEPLTLRLDYRPPLAWETLLRFLGRRAISGLESVCDGTYRRKVVDGDRTGTVTVTSDPARPSLLASIPILFAPRVTEIVAGLRHLFDLDARPDLIDAHLGEDPFLAPLVARRPGLRVPGAFAPFELAIRTVLGQQVSVAAASTLCDRFVESFGGEGEADDRDVRFPTPSRVASLSMDDVRAIGIPRTRAETILRLSRAVADGRLDLSPGADAEIQASRLREIRGIGPWTTQYLLMRTLRWPDAFPAHDLGIRKSLGVSTPARAETRSRPWAPWRAYAALHLWHRGPARPARADDGPPPHEYGRPR